MLLCVGVTMVSQVHLLFSTATNVTLSTDVMMVLNVAVAITCFAFCWTMLVVGFKGWLKSRTHAAVSFHPSV